MNVFKLSIISITVVELNFMWLYWIGTESMPLSIILYATFLGVFHILSVAFRKDETTEWHRAMKLNKEQFLSHIEERFIVTALSEALFIVKEIKEYCKKNDVPENDSEIKNIMDIFVKMTTDVKKETEGTEAANDKD